MKIAEICSISPWTVDNVLKIIRARLDAKTNAQALAKAIALEMLILDHAGNVTAPKSKLVAL